MHRIHPLIFPPWQVMEASILHSLAPSLKPSIFAFTTATTSPPLLLFRRRRRPLATVTASASGGSGGGEQGTPAPPVVPPDVVEVRFRRGSRRRRQPRGDGVTTATAAAKERAAPPPKKWEDMSVAEKAVELYVGEKGLLFWLNKFAYASIFIVIGAWILFRFVGPALNLYQLDTPPLAPTSLLKG